MMTDDEFVRLFQQRAGLAVDGWPGRDTLAALDKVPPPPRPLASVSSQIPDDYWPMLSRIESGDRPYVQAATSSASGLYQFIKSTWEAEGGNAGRGGSAAGFHRPAAETHAGRTDSDGDGN